MTIYALDGLAPRIAEDSWIAPDANVIGNVTLEEGGSIWFGCTLRGDNEPIVIGAGRMCRKTPSCIPIPAAR